MTRGSIYKCSVCGNIVELLYSGGGKLVCCGKEMELLPELEDAEEGMEKHVPVVETVKNGVKVKIGSVPHPMQDDHSILWIEVVAQGQSLKKFLKVPDAPEAVFAGIQKSEIEKVREYCNVHGLWKA